MALEKQKLSRQLDSQTFQNFYYLKEELVAFCRAEGLPTSGSKIELTQRIAYYLETGQIKSIKKVTKVKTKIENITEDMLIEPNFVCSEKHRVFFKEKIGKSFSFNVAFQKWLKANTGQTYQAAIEAYAQILEDKKKKTTTIDKQFEYNTYIRDFFHDNQGKSLKEAIQCWKYKKSLPGHNRYERTDLEGLEV